MSAFGFPQQGLGAAAVAAHPAGFDSAGNPYATANATLVPPPAGPLAPHMHNPYAPYYPPMFLAAGHSALPIPPGHPGPHPAFTAFGSAGGPPAGVPMAPYTGLPQLPPPQLHAPPPPANETGTPPAPPAASLTTPGTPPTLHQPTFFVGAGGVLLHCAPGFVRHRPSGQAGTRESPFSLCPEYDSNARRPDETCPRRRSCPYAHIDTRNATPATAHQSFAWLRLEDVAYERFAAGHDVDVMEPGTNKVVDRVRMEGLLKTAAPCDGRPLLHCAHYYFNRRCDRGENCRFAHMVFVDPDASELRRAPAPVQMGRPHRDRPAS